MKLYKRLHKYLKNEKYDFLNGLNFSMIYLSIIFFMAILPKFFLFSLIMIFICPFDYLFNYMKGERSFGYIPKFLSILELCVVDTICLPMTIISNLISNKKSKIDIASTYVTDKKTGINLNTKQNSKDMSVCYDDQNTLENQYTNENNLTM